MLIRLEALRQSPPMAANPFLRHAVTFAKHELNAILSVYSFQVSKGIWRDYAVDFTRDLAAFSMYRSAHEQPVVSVIKMPANTSTGFVFEVYAERKRISRTADLAKALAGLQDHLND